MTARARTGPSSASASPPASFAGAFARGRATVTAAGARVPTGRVATTGEAVSAALWPASAGPSFAVGHDLVVDGGVTG